MKAEFTKRVIAYIVDIVIVTILAQLITGVIPTSERAKGSLENLVDLTKQFTEKKISNSEYSSLVLNAQYNVSRETVIQELITIAVYIGYFVVLPFYKEGQTIGKKIFGIKIKRKQNDKLTINSLLIRALILYNIALNILSEILIVTLTKNSYLNANKVFGYVNIAVIMVTIFMMIINKDGRGLHDLASGTIVVSEEEKKWEI